MARSSKALERYASHDRQKIPGWLSRIDAEIIKTILLHQNLRELQGAVAEIGVHYGKCFLELCLAMKKAERAYVIDIFDNQVLNMDASGCGNQQILLDNLATFGIAAGDVTIDPRPSQEVVAEDILSKVGRTRMFSVDGGHWLDVVENDLKLAEATLAEYGVIALDDFHRPEWPDVSAGYFAWYAARSTPLVPIAIGFNKLYLAHENWAVEYRTALEANAFLAAFATKKAVFQGQPLLVYQRYLVQELPLRNLVEIAMMTFTPGLYSWAKRRANRPVLSSFDRPA